MPCKNDTLWASAAIFCSVGAPAAADEDSHPAVRLSFSDFLGADDTEVPHIVLHAALVKSFQSGDLFLLHSHDELPTHKYRSTGDRHKTTSSTAAIGGQRAGGNISRSHRKIKLGIFETGRKICTSEQFQQYRSGGSS